MHIYSGHSVSYLTEREWKIPSILTDRQDIGHQNIGLDSDRPYDREVTIQKATDWFVRGFLNWTKRHDNDEALRQAAWENRPFFPFDTIESGRDAVPYFYDLALIFSELMGYRKREGVQIDKKLGAVFNDVVPSALLGTLDKIAEDFYGNKYQSEGLRDAFSLTHFVVEPEQIARRLCGVWNKLCSDPRNLPVLASAAADWMAKDLAIRDQNRKKIRSSKDILIHEELYATHSNLYRLVFEFSDVAHSLTLHGFGGLVRPVLQDINEMTQDWQKRGCYAHKFSCESNREGLAYADGTVPLPVIQRVKNYAGLPYGLKFD